MIEGNDGGASVTFNGGRSWSTIFNQPTAQFYHVTTDDQVPYRVYGSQQDNYGHAPAEHRLRGRDHLDRLGRAGRRRERLHRHQPPSHRIRLRWRHRHGRRARTADPLESRDRPEAQHHRLAGGQRLGLGRERRCKYRFQWTFPIVFSPHDPDVLYVSSNHVHRSTDEGTSWEAISPDLTRNDPEKLQSSGGPITGDNTGAEVYCTIFAFAESPHEQGVFWAGSDDGLVHVSRDGGKTWQNITPPDLPEWAHDLASSSRRRTTRPPPMWPPRATSRTTSRPTSSRPTTTARPGPRSPTASRTTSSRASSARIRTAAGCSMPAPRRASTSPSTTARNWQRLESNLPVAPIHDLVVKGTDLVAATHGRSFWILDDLTPLHQLQEQIAGKSAHLFKPRDTTRVRHYGRAYGDKTSDRVNYMMAGPVTVALRARETPMGTQEFDFLDAGKNPPNGVVIHYYLKSKPDGDVTLRILDASGNEINAFSSEGDDTPRVPVAAGANRFVWDYRGSRSDQDQAGHAQESARPDGRGGSRTASESGRVQGRAQGW